MSERGVDLLEYTFFRNLMILIMSIGLLYAQSRNPIDAGFAMTSSLSTMLLTALAIFDAPCDVSARLNALADSLDDLLPQFLPAGRPERVVYVGTGPLAFAARDEAAFGALLAEPPGSMAPEEVEHVPRLGRRGEVHGPPVRPSERSKGAPRS